jgi:23S rRNA (uracil1939-C5)-methyltransferase
LSSEAVVVEKFSHDLRGIARQNGKTIFIDGAIPDETVTITYTKSKKDYAEARISEVLEASVARVEPECPHFGVCGGCSLQHLDAASQIKYKEAVLLDILARVGHLQPKQVLPPLQAAIWNYRHKARLSVRYVEKKSKILLGFREKLYPRYIAEIHTCKVLAKDIDAVLKPLALLLESMVKMRAISQIEVAADDASVVLIIRNLEDLPDDDIAKLRAFSQLDIIPKNFILYLQPNNAEPYPLFTDKALLSYKNYFRNLNLYFYPTDFTQVNPSLNKLMVLKVVELLALDADDVVLDLFCGIGNFSLPIATLCHKVIGIEGSDLMVERAHNNASLNNIDNVEFYCYNLELTSSIKALSLNKCNKVLLDPPRSGALEFVKNIDLFAPKMIVYVSCNPLTLARDAEILLQHNYVMQQALVMDMFTHTSHVESLAVFTRS